MNKVILYGPLPPLYSYGGPVRSLNELRTLLNKELNLICISPNYHLNRSKIEISSTKDILYTSYPFFELIKKCLKNKNTTVWYNSFFDLGFIFFLLITPISVIGKIFKRDHLKINLDKNIKTYWIRRDNSFAKEDFNNQF